MDDKALGSGDIFPKTSSKTYGLMELVKGKSSITAKEPEQTSFVWPNLVKIEMISLLAVTVLLVLLSLFFNAPLEELASTSTTPNPMKAPWYFLGLQELLVFFDPWMAGFVLPSLIIAGLMVIPYVDFNKKGIGYYTFKERKFAVLTFTFGLALWYVLIVVGTWFRGLDWQWYWLWENQHIHKPPLGTELIDLQLIFHNYLGISIEIANLITYILVLGFYGVGMAIPFLLFRNFYKQLGLVRYNIVMFFFLTMMGVPLKIYLRLLFNIKYVLVTPWFKI